MSKPPAPPSPPNPSALSALITTSGAKSAAECLAISIVHNLQHQHDWTELRLHLVYLNQNHGQGHHITTANGGTLSPTPGIIDLEGLSFHHSNSSSRTASPARSSNGSSGTNTPTSSTTGASLLPPSPLPTNIPTTTTFPSPPQHSPDPIPLISGLPPSHIYIHPTLQTHLIKHSLNASDLLPQREFILPLSLGEKFTLGKFCSLFDRLPQRDAVRVLRHQHQQPRSSSDGRRQGNAAPMTTTNGNGTPRGVGTGMRPRVFEHQDQKRMLLGMRASEGFGGDGTVVYYIMQEGEVKPRQNG